MAAMKAFLGKPLRKGWKTPGKGAPAGNKRAAGRKQGRAFSYRHERHEDVAPLITRRGKRDYLHANCVVLAAAIFGPWAEQWARDLLPAARQLDARGLK
jgi:hypothetical protein